MAAFAVAITAGLAAGNDAFSILLRATLAMIVCYPPGLLAGMLMQGVVREHVEAQRARSAGSAASASPPSSSPSSGSPTGSGASAQGVLVV
jgi:hypothetical protein